MISSCVYLSFKIFSRLENPLETQKQIFFENDQSFLVNYFAKYSSEIILLIAFLILGLLILRKLKS